MLKKLIVITLLISIFSCNLFAQDTRIDTTQKEKSLLLGIFLGALGFTGVLVPGTYGWGNFYAGDKNGFMILNIGGSAFTLLEYYAVSVNPHTEDPPPLFTVGLIGSLCFAVASVTWGALSVTSYNYRNIDRKQLSYHLTPNVDGLIIEIDYCY